MSDREDELFAEVEEIMHDAADQVALCEYLGIPIWFAIPDSGYVYEEKFADNTNAWDVEP